MLSLCKCCTLHPYMTVHLFEMCPSNRHCGPVCNCHDAGTGVISTTLYLWWSSLLCCISYRFVCYAVTSTNNSVFSTLITNRVTSTRSTIPVKATKRNPVLVGHRMTGMVRANNGTAVGAHGSCALVANLVSELLSGGSVPLHKLAFVLHHILAPVHVYQKYGILNMQCMASL